MAGTIAGFGVEVLARSLENGSDLFYDFVLVEIPRHWRVKKQRLALVGEVCPHCDYKIFPPRGEAPCPNCEGTAAELYTVDHLARGETPAQLVNDLAEIRD